MYNILAVFIGSGLGGVCRWMLSSYLNGHYPIGTLTANVIGCFLLGLLSKLAPGDPHLKLLLTTGFCGGFTTFSTFMNEDFLMLKGGQLLQTILYAAITLVLGMIAVWIGWKSV